MHRIEAFALLVLGLLLGLTSAPALAQVSEIYKCVDGGGRPLYTSDKRDTAGKKCELVSREVNVVPAQKGAPGKAGSPAGFPREGAAARASSKVKQRDILEKELAAEQDMLAKAKKDLGEQESVRSGDERNYARVLERLQKYKDNVEVHEKNVEALKRELGNLAR